MCNCGNKRRGLSQQTHASSVNTQRRTSVQTSPAYASFEYIGKTALTIVGSVTGMQYRFNSPGTRQSVDYRDMAGMISIPVLKKVN